MSFIEAITEETSASYYTHREVEKRMDVTEWELSGKPHTWLKVQETNGYLCYIDVAYGQIAIFNSLKGTFNVGKFIALLDNAIALDIEYYGTKTYLYFEEQV
jgi:hypothetical protein